MTKKKHQQNKTITDTLERKTEKKTENQNLQTFLILKPFKKTELQLTDVRKRNIRKFKLICTVMSMISTLTDLNGRFYTKDALSVWTNLGKYFVVRLG